VLGAAVTADTANTVLVVDGTAVVDAGTSVVVVVVRSGAVVMVVDAGAVVVVVVVSGGNGGNVGGGPLGVGSSVQSGSSGATSHDG
jgi:hypothetical protein